MNKLHMAHLTPGIQKVARCHCTEGVKSSHWCKRCFISWVAKLRCILLVRTSLRVLNVILFYIIEVNFDLLTAAWFKRCPSVDENIYETFKIYKPKL